MQSVEQNQLKCNERPNPAMSIKLAVDTFCCVVCRADSRLLSSDQSAIMIRGSLACGCVVDVSWVRHSPETSRHTFSHFGPSQHSLRLLRETSLGKTLAATGLTRVGLVLLRFSKPKHQPTTNPGSGPLGPPARAGFAALAKAFAGNKFRPNPRGCGLNSGRASPLDNS